MMFWVGLFAIMLGVVALMCPPYGFTWGNVAIAGGVSRIAALMAEFA